MHIFSSCTLAFLLFISCTTEHKEVPIFTVSFDNSKEEFTDSVIKYPQDGIKREIPEDYIYPYMLSEHQKVETALKIGSLKNGFPGQQIRIYGSEFDEMEKGWGRLMVLTNNDSWTADLYYLRFAAEDDLIMIIDSLQYQKHSLGQPKSGWSIFMDSLENYGFFTLPDYTAIEGYEYESTHEVAYNVEIATHDSYRVYSYLNPIRREKRFPEAKKFAEILQFIKRQFSLPEPYTPKEKWIKWRNAK